MATTSRRERRGTDVNLRTGAQMREYETLADRVARDVDGKVLDWGCGWGQVTKLLSDRGVDVEPYDYREDAKAVGRAALERYPEIECTFSAEPVALPYEDDSFDAVVSCGVLEHVQDPDASLDELHRVLKPGGALIIIKLPNRRSYLEWIAKRTGLYYHGALEHDTLYTCPWARELVGRHSFEVKKTRLANMLPLTVDSSLATRLAPVIWPLNRGLAKVPGLNRLATNVEVDATAK
jgi:ubiquinone/menaquinone biosynthesis C-methylase UbiE